MAYQIVVDDSQIRRFLRRAPKQIPFAMKTALNGTAKQVRQHIVRNVWPRSVSPKARGFAGRAFRTRFATKTSLISAVFADPSQVSPEGIEAIDRVARGIRHYPFRGRWLAVPTRRALTRGGRVTASAKRALVARDGDPKYYLADFGRGPAIWERMRGGNQKLLFVLKPFVPTPRVFAFGREAERKATAIWPRNLRRAVVKALRTAR